MQLIKRTVIVVGLLVIVAAIIGANFQRNPELLRFKWKLKDEVPLEVRTEPALKQRIVPTVEAPGEVEADVEVEISAQVVGRILKLPVREGDVVHKGDLLVQIDAADFEADVRSAAARVERLKASSEVAEHDLAKSKRDLERTRQLFETRATSSSELADIDTATSKNVARLAMNKAELVEAEAMLAKANESLTHTTIRSPIAGVVSHLIAEEGEVVVVGTMNNAGTVIMIVSDLSTRVVRARVDETDIPKVRPGQKAVIHLQYDEREPLLGRVERITPKGIKPSAGGQAASSSREIATFETVISIDAPTAAVHLQMSANVEIQIQERDDVLTVPSQAVLHRRLKDLPRRLAEQAEKTAPRGLGAKDVTRQYYQVVFVESNGKAECRVIETGVSDERRIEITAGVKPGDRIVTGPYRVFDALKDGKPIQEIAADATVRT